MSYRLDLGAVLRGAGHSTARIDAFLSTLDDATAARLLKAWDDGDRRAVMKAFSTQTWDLSPARAKPSADAPTGSRSPRSFEKRLMEDPNVRRAMEASGETMPTDPAEVLPAVQKAYRGAAPKRGRPKKAKTNEDAIRELRAEKQTVQNIASQFDRAAHPLMGDSPRARQRALKVARESYPAEWDIDAEDLMTPERLGGLTPEYRRLLQELEKNEWLGFDYPSQAVSSVLEYGDAPSRWDMTPDLLEARDAMIFARRPSGPGVPVGGSGGSGGGGGGGLIPYGTRGPGVPVGGPGGPGVTVDPGTELIPSQPRRIGGQTRALSRQEPRGMNPFREEDVRPVRIVDEAPPKKRFNKKLAAAAAAGGTVAVDLMMRGRNQDEPAVTSGGEADLANEARPVPEVQPEPTDYLLEAAKLRTRLNDMRKAAGGEVPEAPAIMAELERLTALGNKQRNQRNPVYQHSASNPARNPRNEANQLVAQVNDYARQGVPMSHPWMQYTMARVRQLQAEGDAIMNRGVR